MKSNILYVIQKMTVGILCLLVFIVSGCGNSKMNNGEDSDSIPCENKEILKILNDEPVIVRKQCFEHIGNIDAFYFELVNQHVEFISDFGIFPAGVIPQEYRKEGLSVYICGDVTNCAISTVGCFNTEYYRLRPFTLHIFELNSIKINNKKLKK